MPGHARRSGPLARAGVRAVACVRLWAAVLTVAVWAGQLHAVAAASALQTAFSLAGCSAVMRWVK